MENSSLADVEQDDFLSRYTLSEDSSETETMRKSLEINMALQKLVMGELNVLHLYLVKCRRRQVSPFSYNLPWNLKLLENTIGIGYKEVTASTLIEV